ncbi:baseplate J family protein [Clostridium sp. AF18-27]|uniref:baseplate assembly protein n=1 Tax=Enterocloster lavalensis TaxID=460384 RepID=UPI000E4CAAD4|nr:baseplate J/gp47 family protein [Enterocloster lavalensis]RHR51982.1 baseplate J family protein [Clostridium sp. AF18-27]
MSVTRLKNYPEISFIEETSFEELKEKMISDYEKRYRELTGNEISLAKADPYRLILYACAVAIYQGYQYEDRAGKMGLLKYSTGEFLDNLAALKGVTRNEAEPARTTLRFTLAALLNRVATIPPGTRVKGQDLYFETTERGEIPAGMDYVDIQAKCQTPGSIGNGFLTGDIRTMVDPLPYTLSVENTAPTSGGADRETDDELAERIYLAPSSYSTAGPKLAYEYWVKTYSPAIGESKVISEVPGEVDIYVMVDGQLPTDDFMAQLEAYMQSGERRPLTDHVVVKKPESVSYDIEFVYYIRKSDQDMVETIQAAVKTACENFIAWQRKIGRDITPSQLVYELVKAGAQSADIKKPEYTELTDSQIAIAREPVITYGGIRDD